MRANTIITIAAALSLLSLAACSDRQNEPLAPKLVDASPQLVKCTPILGNCPVSLAAIDLSAGIGVTCAVHVTGAGYCWGDNTNGMLGTGTMTLNDPACTTPNTATNNCSTKPMRVAGLSFSSISVGGYHVCGIEKGTGKAYCWGQNGNGQLGFQSYLLLGQPGPPITAGPTFVVKPPAGSSAPLTFTAIAAGGESTCGVTTSQQLYCWGYGYGVAPVAIPGSYLNVSANYDGPCALGTNGRSCAGWRNDIQLISQGSAASHSCQINGGDGSENTECWGDNSLGQLGDGTFNTASSRTPTAVKNMFFQAVAVGSGHTCAIQSGTGNAYCWGDDRYGELGDWVVHNLATTPQAVVMPAGTTFTKIAAGGGHTCAVDAYQGVWCWGNGAAGQLGFPGGNLLPTHVGYVAN